jgi:hypothetical protein
MLLVTIPQEKLITGVGDLAQWKSACLASARPRVRSPPPEKKKAKNIKKKKKKEKLITVFVSFM